MWRYVIACLMFAAMVECATAQSSARLPAAMLGVWAPRAEVCAASPESNAESRVGVAPETVDFFASGYRVRAWRRRGDGFAGVAQVSEEGEGMLPGSYPVALRLLANGRLEIIRDKERNTFVKCPKGARLR